MSKNKAIRLGFIYMFISFTALMIGGIFELDITMGLGLGALVVSGLLTIANLESGK